MINSGASEFDPILSQGEPFVMAEHQEMDTLLPGLDRGAPSEVDAMQLDSPIRFRDFSPRALMKELRATPQGVNTEFWARKVGNDIQESQNKARTVGSFVTGAGFQAADRLNLSFVLIPAAATDVLRETSSAPLTGLTAGVIFTAWYLGVGGTFTEGMHQFPKTVEAATANFPSVVELFDDSLPGVVPPEKMKSIKDVPKRISRRIKRGLSVVGLGTTAHVATGTLKGLSKKKTHQLNINAAVDGGAVLAVAVTGVAEGIIKLSEKHPEVAQQLQDEVGRTRNWYLVAGAVLATQWWSSRSAKKQAAREQADSED